MTEKIIHGFRLTKKSEVPELSAKLNYYTHEKSGAELLFIDRDDENKTFAIAFKTLPEDNTGVFHIIEHSVLCGSKKFPVKEPFVELLKASLKTFLNAFTFPDKTMYPVSSRNGKDFLNLIDVYMDAVLHPLCKTMPEIFYQEGWHYEIESPDKPFGYKGVVFNEMKGAYSTVDEIEMSEMAKLLYEGSVYGYDYGGDPKHIPDLTYENYCRAHDKYYHPSNAQIILDGGVNLDEVLGLLDGYLSEYDAREPIPEIPFIEPKGMAEKTVLFEVGENENTEDKIRLCLGFLTAKFNESREKIALAVITDAIAGSNEAPFKKAFLDAGIGEDICFFPYDGIAHNSLMLEVRNIREEDIGRAKSFVMNTLKKLTENGFSRELLAASLSRMEFRAREQDGAYPAGLTNVLAAIEGWLYGGDPKDALSFEDDFAFMREALSTDYYERIFEKYILNSAHSAILTLLPSKELADKRLSEEAERLANEKAAMSESEISEKIEEQKKLEEWQNTPNSKEALATIPRLSISDLSPLPQKYEYSISHINGTDTLFIPAASKGICYADLLLDISDLEPEDIFNATLMCDLFKNVRTEKSSAVDLQTKIKNDLGALYFAVMGFERDNEVKTYIRAHMSFLESKSESAIGIMKEVTELSDFLGEGKVITNFLKQTKTAAKDSIISSGTSAAINRIGAYTSAEAAVSEYTDGLEFYLMVKELTDNLADRLPKLLEKLTELKDKIFKKERLTVIYTGKENTALAERLTELYEVGGITPGASCVKPLGIRREGISIPSQVAYACMGSNMREAYGNAKGHGSFAVAKSLLTLDYLWGKIRVGGGAYGAGLTHRVTGSVAFYSYRDPSPARSVEVYHAAKDYLKEFAASGEDMTGIIIGTVGELDHLITPKLLGILVLRDYIRRESYESRALRRSQIINTTHDDIASAADQIEKICENAGICIVAGADKLAECKHLIDTVIEI